MTAATSSASRDHLKRSGERDPARPAAKGGALSRQVRSFLVPLPSALSRLHPLNGCASVPSSKLLDDASGRIRHAGGPLFI
jgi:poly(3-hydroxybutyrate) depolymerase